MNFPIIGWQEMPKELTLPEVYADIAGSGINVFMTCSDSPEHITAQLDLAAEHGLQALIRDPRFKATDVPGWQDEAIAAVRDYGDHPATYGFYVRDEPVRGEFEREGRMVALLKKARPDKVAFVNGLGWGSRGADCFLEYVEDYARVIKPEFLAFDSYPMSLIPDDADTSEFYKADRGIEWPELKAYYRDRYFETWETYRLVGWKYDLPISGIILATPHHHSACRYAMVVNRNPARRSRTSITMQDGWTAISMDISNGLREVPQKAVFELELKPGDGRLLRLDTQLNTAGPQAQQGEVE